MQWEKFYYENQIIIMPLGKYIENSNIYIQAKIGEEDFHFNQTDWNFLVREKIVPSSVSCPNENLHLSQISKPHKPALKESSTPALKIICLSLAQNYFPQSVYPLFTNVEVRWNNRFQGRTAGLYKVRTIGAAQIKSIELSSKYMDFFPQQLRPVMLHEMLHATLPISEKHGSRFKLEAQRMNSQLQQEGFTQLITVRVPQNMSMPRKYKYKYRCKGCGRIYSRVRRPVDTKKMVCGKCKGKLELIKSDNM